MLKKVLKTLSTSVVLVIVFSGIPENVFAAGNMVVNPSVETPDPANVNQPQGWSTGHWGTNVATFSYLSTGNTGTRSVKTQITTAGTGDAKWYFQKIPVTAGTTYTFSDFFQSDVPSRITVEYTNSNGTFSYVDLVSLAASPAWKQFSRTFVVPAGVTSLTVYHLITSVGSLTVDDYSIADGSTAVTPFAFSLANSGAVSVLQGQSVQNTISATLVSGTASSVVFSATGLPTGASISFAAPSCVPSCTSVATIQTSSATPAGIYPIQIIGTSGTTTATTNISLTVNAIVVTPPPLGNLIQNPTFALGTTNAPSGWFTGAWGSAAGAVFSYPVAGVDDAFAASLSIASYAGGPGSGAAEWYFSPVAVTGGSVYTFSDSYKSTTASNMVAQWTMNDNSVSYTAITTLPSSAGAWKSTTQFFIAPANAKTLTILHLLQSAGSLTVDTYSLTSSVPAGNGYTKGIVTLSFDDGLMTQYDNVLPVLQNAQIPATFYIITDAMNGAASDVGPDLFTDPNENIVAAKTANSSTWSEIYIDPTESQYRFSDTYTSAAPSTISVRYVQSGIQKSVVLGTVSAGTNARAAFSISLPIVGGSAVTPITIVHSGTALTTSQPSLTVGQSLYMTSAQVQQVQTTGMEVGAHTKTHPDLTSLPAATSLAEISGSRQALLAVGMTPVDTLAYPQGTYNALIESQVSGSGFAAARSVDIGFNTKTTDKYALKSQSVTTATTAAEMQSWIDAAIANKLWLVITIHDVDSIPNLNAIGDPYGTTPQILQQVVSYLQTKRAAGVVDVKTVHDGALAN